MKSVMAEMVGPARFERATLCLEGRCSIQLSYGPVRLFYQCRRNSKRQIIHAAPGKLSVHAYASLARMLGKAKLFTI
jgi:hypothetical protein